MNTYIARGFMLSRRGRDSNSGTDRERESQGGRAMDRSWSRRVCGRLGVIVYLVVTASATFPGCRTVPVELAAPEVRRLDAPVARLGELETGRVIYTSHQKCARCHRPKPVTDHTAADWSETILPRMAKKAKLSDLETRYVLNYILTARSLGNQTVESR
jgi:hypothetical protein